MRGFQAHLFATRADLVPGLTAIDSANELRYLRDGSYESEPSPIFNSLLAYPGLGKNETGDHSDYGVLVFPASEQLGFEQRKTISGLRWFVHQDRNPHSIMFSPGGFYEPEKCLVCGHIGTIWTNAESKDLFRMFVRTLTKGFKKVREFRVGPEALKMMRAGTRMVTIGVGSPREYDLREITGASVMDKNK